MVAARNKKPGAGAPGQSTLSLTVNRLHIGRSPSASIMISRRGKFHRPAANRWRNPHYIAPHSHSTSSAMSRQDVKATFLFVGVLSAFVRAIYLMIVALLAL
jgi:hypothetical protein